MAGDAGSRLASDKFVSNDPCATCGDQILPFLDTPHGTYATNPEWGFRYVSACSSFCGISIMRMPIGSVFSCYSGRNRLPAMRVFGTRLVSTTRTQGHHFIEPKYSAAAFSSSSVNDFASSIIVFVFGFLGSALCRLPLRQS